MRPVRESKAKGFERDARRRTTRRFRIAFRSPLQHRYPLRGCSSDFAQYSNTPTLQHSNTPTLQHSNTPTLRAAGFEDEDDDEDENEAPRRRRYGRKSLRIEP